MCTECIIGYIFVFSVIFLIGFLTSKVIRLRRENRDMKHDEKLRESKISYYEMVKLLIEEKVNVIVMNGDGTAFHTKTLFPRMEFLNLLRSHQWIKDAEFAFLFMMFIRQYDEDEAEDEDEDRCDDDLCDDGEYGDGDGYIYT